MIARAPYAAFVSYSHAADAALASALQANARLEVWRIDAGGAKPAFQFAYPSDVPNPHAEVVFSTDGSRVAFALARHGGAILETRAGELVAAIAQTQTVIGFDAKLDHALVAENEGRILLRVEREGLRRLRELDRGDGSVNVLHALSPDGRRSAWASQSGAGPQQTFTAGFALWDFERQATAGQVAGAHTRAITALAFAPDGRHLATGSYDKTVRIWHVETLQEVFRTTLAAAVNALSFSGDGKLIAIGAEDGTAAVSSWQPDELIAQACARLNRNLTRAEWRQHLGEIPYRGTCPALPEDVSSR